MDRIDELYTFMKEKYDTSIPVVKKKIKKTEFFHYFFKEKKKITEWNRKKYLLQFSFFKFKVKPISTLHYKIDSFYLKYLLPVSKFLPEIITNGWQEQILSIREYNTIVFFEDFCNKCSPIGAGKSLSVKHYLFMEESFLKLICNPQTIQTLLTGLKKIFIFYKKKFFKSDALLTSHLKNLSLFFSESSVTPSFFDLIIAFNISYYRKYLTIYDLMTNYNKIIIPTHFYSCSRDIFRMIVSFLKTTVEELRELQNEVAHIERLKTLSTLGESKIPTKIITFYSNSGHEWEIDSFDAFLLILVLMEEIYDHMRIFIKEEWQVMNDEEKIITLKIVSSPEADIIYAGFEREFQYAKARHSSLLSSPITLQNFMDTDNPIVMILDPAQKYIHNKIGNMFTCLHDLANIFYDIYENQSEGYRKLLRYMVTHPDRWSGKPVFAVYRYYIELFLQICGFFKEKTLGEELQKYPHRVEEMKRLKAKLKWTSDTHNFIVKAIENNELEEENDETAGKEDNEYE